MGRDLRNQELGKGIRQRKDGRYEARAQINGQCINIYNDNLDALRKEFEVCKSKLGYKEPVVIGLTLNEWFNEWFDTYKAPYVKPTSAVTMKGKFNNTFGKYIGNVALKQISTLMIQKTINTMTADKVSISSIRDTVGRLKACLESARNANLIDTNPCFDIRVPWHKKNKLKRFLTIEEQEIFLRAAKGNWYEEMYQFMFLTGLRIGEIGGLKWQDIDFDNGIIHIQRALMCQYNDGVKTLLLTTVKTVNSYRSIPFMGNVRDVLNQQKKKQDLLKEHLGKRWRAEEEFNDLVFTTNMGSPVTRYSAESQINKIVKAINDEENIKAKLENRSPKVFENMYPHAFRHTFASRCFESGMDIKIVQSLMGHENYSTTLDVYTHVTNNYMESEISKFKITV